MNKKRFSLIGMCISLAIVILGVILLLSVSSDYPHFPDTTIKDNGFATFGSDFYTYVNNNAAIAASATRAIAYNQINFMDILESIHTTGAFLLIAFGALGFCFFGTFGFCGCESAGKEEQEAKQPSEQNDT